MAITKYRKQIKADNLTERLIGAIVTGVYPAGSKISEPELARVFDVSRGPLREAMMRVESLNLVERIPHIGARVISLSLEKLTEIYAIREVLEVMAVSLACKHISAEQLAKLDALVSKHQPLSPEDDYIFHTVIIKASNNAQLITLLCGQIYHLVQMYHQQLPATNATTTKKTHEQYVLLNALKAGDCELAEVLMRRHIKTCLGIMVDRYQHVLQA